MVINSDCEGATAAEQDGGAVVQVAEQPSSSNRPEEESWLKSLFVLKVDLRKGSFPNQKGKSSLHKLQFYSVKLEGLEAYNKICQRMLPEIQEDKHEPCSLMGT